MCGSLCVNLKMSFFQHGTKSHCLLSSYVALMQQKQQYHMNHQPPNSHIWASWNFTLPVSYLPVSFKFAVSNMVIVLSERWLTSLQCNQRKYWVLNVVNFETRNLMRHWTLFKNRTSITCPVFEKCSMPEINYEVNCCQDVSNLRQKNLILLHSIYHN